MRLNGLKGMRSRSGWLLGLICACLLLSACGAEPGSSGGAAEAGGSAPAADTRAAGGDGQSEAAGGASADVRIISTTVAITEILDVLEMDLVGVPTSVKALSERYAGVEQVGNPMSPDMEKLRLLKPDEVLSVTTLEYDLAPKFASAGIDAEFLDLTSLARMNETIMQLGERYNRMEQAERLVRDHERKLEQAQAAIAGKEAPRVLILMGIPGSYLVATEHSYIGDLVKSLGGVNIVQGETVEYVASNTEHLQQANPDVILRAAHGLPEQVVLMFDKEFRTNDIWKHFNAVKTGRVYDLEETRFGTTGNLAVGDALDELVEMLYE